MVKLTALINGQNFQPAVINGQNSIFASSQTSWKLTLAKSMVPGPVQYEMALEREVIRGTGPEEDMAVRREWK